MKRTLVLVCMLMTIAVQYGVVLFHDDFNRSEGSAIGNGWTNIGPVNPIIENGSMKIVSNSLQGVRRDFSSLGISSGSYYISFDWKIGSNNWLADAFPNGTITYLRHDYEGNLYYDNTSDFSNPINISTLELNTWANFKLKVNLDTDRFHIWINNILVAENIAGSAVNDFTRFTFRAGSGSTVTQYIDNFIVYNDTPPATPTNLTATETVNDITLSWNGTPQDFLTYRIYRSTTSPASDLLAEVPSTQNSFVDNTAAANTDYFYRVKAVSMNTIESGYSNEVTAHLQPDIAVNPTEITVKLNATSNTANASFDITNTGLGKLDYSISGTDSYNTTTTLPPIAGFTAMGVFNGHSYYRSNSTLTWAAARTLCEQNGGHLVTIASSAENDFVHQNTTTASWLGFTDEINEGTWRWVTNEPVVYTKWNTGEPNNTGGVEDYAQNRANGDKWNDVPNNASVPAVFEIDSLPITSILSFTPTTGTINTSQAQNIAMSVTGTALTDGLYQTSARIVSNAPEPRDTLYIPVTVKVDYTPPTAPTDLLFDEIQSDMNQVYLSWTANAIADSVYSYKVYRRGLHDSSWVLKGRVPSGQTWFIDTQFTGLDTTAVYYKISAVDWVDNEGAASEEVMAWLQRFPAPTGLSMEIIRDRHVKLNWNPVTQTISGNPGTPSCYVIYRSNTPSPLEDFYFVGAVDATTFTHNWAAWFIELGKQFYIVTSYSGSFEDLRSVANSRSDWKYGELERAATGYVRPVDNAKE